MVENTDMLLRQIQLGEDSSLELKDLRYKGDSVSAPHRDSMADELAAMANTGSGTFILGVADKSRTINGIPRDKLDITEMWVRDICNDLITPPLFCTIRKTTISLDDGTERIIIKIHVPKSLQVHQSPGGYFHRVGSSKRNMAPDVLARLFQHKSQSRMVYFDEYSVNRASTDCLDKSLWEKFRTALSPTDDDEFLLKLKLTSRDEDGRVYPTVSGILMACRQPHEYIDNALIQAVAYRGTERNAAGQLDARDITGPLDTQITEACHFVERNMKIGAIKNPARQDIPQYSMHAVFEAVANAVAHRDYSIHRAKIRLQMFSDRMEIYSPGTVTNTMTIDSLHLRQSARNELLASLLARCPISFSGATYERKFMMDKRGEGVPIILSASKELSGRIPQYQLLDDAELMLTIYAAEPPHS